MILCREIIIKKKKKNVHPYKYAMFTTLTQSRVPERPQKMHSQTSLSYFPNYL